MKRQSVPTEKELALRKWCIDCAVRWPWSPPIGYQHGMASLPQQFRPADEPSIINRATAIYNWVTRKEDK